MKQSGMEMTVRLMFRLLPVQVLLAVIGSVNGMVTSIFATNFVGSIAMTAVGLYSPMSFLIGAVSTILAGGSMILCGRYMGRNMREKTQGVFSLDMLICVAAAAVFILVHLGACLFSDGFMTRDPVLWPIYRVYLLGQAVGILPQILGSHLASFLSLENKVRRTTVASLAYIGVNVLLNYLFLSVLRMEAFGLALASSLGMWVFFLIEALYFFRPDSRLKIRRSSMAWEESLSIIRIGLPGAMNNVYWTVRGLIVNSLILSYVGNAGLSAFTAGNSLLALFWAIPGGMQAVSRMLISIADGEEDRRTLTDIMKAALTRYLPLMIAISVLLSALAVPFTRLYFRDPSEPVYQMTVWAFRILPFAMPFTLVNTHFTTYWQASGRQFPVHLLALLDGFLSVSAITAALIPSAGIFSVYIANVLNGLVSLVTVFLYSAVKNRKWPANLEELMVIPASFGAGEDERMDIGITDAAQVPEISEKVERFCRDRGIDQKRSFYAALALEEMAGNVITHGFTKDRKPHSMAIRVVHKGDDVILRIRDDCVAFDPYARLSVDDPNDPARNIGIRLVYKIASEVSYQNILGLNVLMVRI